MSFVKQYASLLIVVGVFLVWVVNYHYHKPLSYESYFSDPELSYYLNSVQLAYHGKVQQSLHPGTLLQACGAILVKTLRIPFNDALKDENINKFRHLWKLISVISTVIIITSLFTLLKYNQTLYWLIVLLSLSDYNNFAFWGTVTPEGSFWVLYFPIILFFIAQISLKNESLFWMILLSVLVGFATTIKITLLPVSLFIIAQIYMIAHGSRLFRLIAFFLCLMAFGASFIFLSVYFALDTQQQAEWYINLITQNGRYGSATIDGAKGFPSIAKIMEHIHFGLKLQNYTTLLPMILLNLVALYDFFRANTTSKDKFLAILFIACFSITWLAFIKHPYQIKYLSVQSILYVLYLLCRSKVYPSIAERKAMILSIVVLIGVAGSAYANFALLHAYTRIRNSQLQEEINEYIYKLEPKVIAFSSEIPHPIVIKAFALREATAFAQQFKEQHNNVQIFRERSEDFKLQSGAPLPLPEVTSEMMVVTTSYFIDQRVVLLHYNEELALFIYYKP